MTGDPAEQLLDDPVLGDGPAEDGTAADAPVALGDAVVPLLRGVVYQATHRRAWAAIERYESQVRDHLRVLNLDLAVDATEGYAYLRRRADTPAGAPNLLRRLPLSYRMSLLLVLLRRQLLYLDQQGDQTRLVMTREEIVELVRTFHPAFANDDRLLRGVDADVNKLVAAGFLRRLRGQDDRIEVLRVVKAFVDAEFLSQWPARLAEYHDIAAEQAAADQGGRGVRKAGRRDPGVADDDGEDDGEGAP